MLNNNSLLIILLLINNFILNVHFRALHSSSLLLAVATTKVTAVAPITATSILRHKRQIDLTLTAEHDDKADDTEIVLEAIANLWRSTDGNTQIEGSAKVVHKSNSFQDGNNHYQARLHLHHDYANDNNHLSNKILSNNNNNKCVGLLYC